jgi:dihydropyrimidine dehydrogenase (NAD+) subunit PreA
MFGKHVIGLTNMEISSSHPLDWWTETVRRIKREFPDRPLFASIIRTEDRTERDWVGATEAFQDAGVDGIELNFSCSHASHARGGGASIGKNPTATRTIAGWVVSGAKVPVIAKLTAATSDIGRIAKAAAKAGVHGITAINSVPGIEGIDFETMAPKPSVDGLSSFTGYSGPAIKPIGLRCVAEVRRAVSIPIMGCGGVWRWQDVVDYMAMGANLVQLCTGPWVQGFDMIQRLKTGLSTFLKKKGFSRVTDLTGIAFSKLVDHGELSRDYKVVARVDVHSCKRCKQCYIACRDGANAAIELLQDETPSVSRDRCIGCSLCYQVCPVPGAISMKKA